MNNEILNYNSLLDTDFKKICDLLAQVISTTLPGFENNIWHKHPVWSDNGNPIVGYSKLKDGVQLLFWSGQSFDEPNLEAEGKFKAAQKSFTSVDEINIDDIKRWLNKATQIQWDYKNIVKRKGVLERLK